jgi:hypothetical protein
MKEKNTKCKIIINIEKIRFPKKPQNGIIQNVAVSV